METIKAVFRAFNIQTQLIAITAFVLGNVVLHYFLLSPGEAKVNEMQHNLEEMKEMYVGLKSTDMFRMVEALQQEVEYFNRKREHISRSRILTEEIPLFISRLEHDAEKAGLSTKTKIVRPKKKSESVTINMSYSGNIHQVLDFLSTLENRNEILLVQNFKIHNPDSTQNQLEGEMQFVLLLLRG